MKLTLTVFVLSALILLILIDLSIIEGIQGLGEWIEGLVTQCAEGGVD